MAKTVVIGDGLYTKMPKTAIPGGRWDYREHAWLATDMIAGSSAKILALGVLPAGHRCMNLFVEAERLDGNSANRALTFSVGLLNSYWGDALAGNYSAKLLSNNGIDNGAAPALTNNVITNASGNNATFITVDNTADLSMNWGVDQKNDRIIAIEVTTNAAGGNGNNGAKIALKYALDID